MLLKIIEIKVIPSKGVIWSNYALYYFEGLVARIYNVDCSVHLTVQEIRC